MDDGFAHYFETSGDGGTMSMHYPDRDIRQRELIPPQKLANVHAIVIGVGVVGRQVALQLAATAYRRWT